MKLSLKFNNNDKSDCPLTSRHTDGCNNTKRNKNKEEKFNLSYVRNRSNFEH